MNPERTERITEWDARPFDGGYDGLRSLVDRNFSGAVTNGIAWAVLVNGRIVGVYDGALSAFEGADGTAHEAPEPAVALLFAMQESAGEPRAQYYTEETPISTVDETLSEGKFTGYVELSENVLSGDYYVVYSAGKSTGVAFVGNSDTLHTGEEAFERAADEVGIYEVYDADLDIVELPEPTEQSARREQSGGSAGVDAAGSDGESEPDGSAAPGDAAASASDATEPGLDADTTEPRSDADATETGLDTGTESGADGSTSPEARARDPGPSEPEAAESASAEPRAGDSPSETEAAVGPDVRESEPDASDRQPEASADSRDPGDRATQADPAAGSAGPDSNGGADSPPASRSQRRDARGPERADPADATGSNGRTGGADSETTDPEDVFSEEAAWRQAQTIPALDPDETERRPDRASPRRTDPADRTRRSATQRRSMDADGTRSSEESGRDRRAGGSGGSTGSSGATGSSGDSTGDRDAAPDVSSGTTDGQVGELNDRIEELEAALAEERDRKEALAERREELLDERDQYEERASRLESRVAELESEIERLRDRLSEAGDGAPGAERTMQPEAAIAGTNLFVRYDSKGSPTLEAVHSGEATREGLSSNLRLEHHTSFEDEGVVVDGQPFREFLHGAVEYRFTRWVVEELPFEIRETGNVSRLRDLYDSIPDVDRVELDGTIAVSSTSAEGERENESFTFDVVFRDRMGDPLFVANLNDSRDPTTESMVDTLVSNAGTVAEKYDDFAAALSVTASFFDPGALDATADATGGGLLSRSKRASYVKLSRKRGFHLCLIETREGGFHLNVPEL